MDDVMCLEPDCIDPAELDREFCEAHQPETHSAANLAAMLRDSVIAMAEQDAKHRKLMSAAHESYQEYSGFYKEYDDLYGRYVAALMQKEVD